MIRILLVDDQALLCEVLQTWLDAEDDFNVVGIAHNGREAIEKVEVLQPDIVLMDIDMPQMDGINATKIVCQRFPNVKVIFLSGHDDDAYLGKSLRAGAKGYLLKNTTAEELVNKIRSVSKNVNLLEQADEGDSTEVLRTQLEELLANYERRFQEQLEAQQAAISNATPDANLYQQYEQRFQDLENALQADSNETLNDFKSQTEANLNSLRQDVVSVNSQLDRTNRNLNVQLDRQLANLKQELDDRVASALDDWSRQRAALQEWAVQRDEMRPSMEEFESKYRNELMSVINPLRSSFRDVDKQIRGLRNWSIAIGLLTILALTFSSYLLVNDFRLRDSLTPPPAETTEENN